MLLSLRLKFIQHIVVFLALQCQIDIYTNGKEFFSTFFKSFSAEQIEAVCINLLSVLPFCRCFRLC